MKVQVTSQGKVYLTSNNHILKAKEKCGVTIGDFVGDIENGKLNAPSSVLAPDFSGVTDLGDYALVRLFDGIISVKNGAISFPNLTQISGNNALDNFCFMNTNITSVSMPSLTTISGQNALRYAFDGCYLTNFELPELTMVTGSSALYYVVGSSPNLTTFSLPKLTSITGNSALSAVCYSCSSLTTINLPLLATVNGDGALANAFQTNTSLTQVEFPELVSVINTYTSVFSSTFQNCQYLTVARFPKLNYLECNASSGACFQSCFNGCQRLTDIYFNGLTTTSFTNGLRAFYSMFNSTSMSVSTNCTIHFPSNLESTIQGLTGYPNFGATAGRLTLAYDLTATS